MAGPASFRQLALPTVLRDFDFDSVSRSLPAPWLPEPCVMPPCPDWPDCARHRTGLDPDAGLHILDATALLDGFLGGTLGFAAVDGTGDDDFAGTHLDFDFSRVDITTDPRWETRKRMYAMYESSILRGLVEHRRI